MSMDSQFPVAFADLNKHAASGEPGAGERLPPPPVREGQPNPFPGVAPAPQMQAAPAAGVRQRIDLTPDVMQRLNQQHAALRAAEQNGQKPGQATAPFFTPPQVSPVVTPQSPHPAPGGPWPAPTVHVQGLTTQDVDARLAPLYQSVEALNQNLVAIADYINSQSVAAAEAPAPPTTVMFRYEDIGDIEAFVDEVLVPPDSQYVILVMGTGRDRPRFLPRKGRVVSLVAPGFQFPVRIMPIGCDWEHYGRHYFVLLRVVDETPVLDEGPTMDAVSAAAEAHQAVEAAMTSQPDARLETGASTEEPSISLAD